MTGGDRPDPIGASPADDDNLRSSLAALSLLAPRDGPTGLEDMLVSVAQGAVRAIPGADGAGLTLLNEGRQNTMVATAEFVRAVDTVQYRLAEGPCISAVAQSRTVRTGSLGRDALWPKFGPRAARLGVRSALSLPLLSAGPAVGSINVYSHARDAFDERAVELGELYATPAAISVENAAALDRARQLAMHLQAALVSRQVIDQALGIVMSRSGATADEAFERLRAISGNEKRKVSVVAQSIVTEAVRRARTRAGDAARKDHSDPGR